MKVGNIKPQTNFVALTVDVKMAQVRLAFSKGVGLST